MGWQLLCRRRLVELADGMHTDTLRGQKAPGQRLYLGNEVRLKICYTASNQMT